MMTSRAPTAAEQASFARRIAMRNANAVIPPGNSWTLEQRDAVVVAAAAASHPLEKQTLEQWLERSPFYDRAIPGKSMVDRVWLRTPPPDTDVPYIHGNVTDAAVRQYNQTGSQDTFSGRSPGSR